MKRLFEKLLCDHRWVKINSAEVFEAGYKRPTKYITLFVCEKCGKFKKVRL